VEASLERLCAVLPAAYAGSCASLVSAVAPAVVAAIVTHASPDLACYDLRLCHVDDGGRMCNLFPVPEEANDVLLGMHDASQVLGQR
jgi:hypothetical protein